MKRFIALLGLLLMSTLLSGCHYIEVDPGQEGVLTYKPYIGTGGVDRNPLTVGNTIHWATTKATIVDMKPWAMKVAFDDFSSKDNIMLDLDTTVILETTDPVTYVTGFAGFDASQSDVFNNNIYGPYGQMVRDVVKTQAFQDMMSNPNTAAQMDATVTERLTQYMQLHGIPLKVVSVSLGRAKPTQVVLDQVNATAAQEQRQKTETATIAAEKARSDAEAARAGADKAYAAGLGYSSEQYAAMQIANIQADACKQAAQCIIVPPGTSVVRVANPPASK